jgi:hypothetical protein
MLNILLLSKKGIPSILIEFCGWTQKFVVGRVKMSKTIPQHTRVKGKSVQIKFSDFFSYFSQLNQSRHKMGVTGIINEQKNNNFKANFDEKFVNRKMC